MACSSPGGAVDAGGGDGGVLSMDGARGDAPTAVADAEGGAQLSDAAPDTPLRPHCDTPGLLGYFVAPSGDDGAAGTHDAPWATIGHSIAQLSPGDTLYVRGGTYAEPVVRVRTAGTADAPIEVLACAGEQPVLDGRDPRYLSPGNRAWEPWDPAVDVFRSVDVLTEGRSGFLEENGRFYNLVSYRTYEDLSSTLHTWSSTEPRYLGPGVYWNDTDGHVYVRLTPPDPEAVFRDYGVPANSDPRENILHLSGFRMGLVFESGAAHMVVDGVDVAGYGVGTRLFGPTGIVLRNMEILASGAAVIVNGGSSHIQLQNLDLRLHRAPWIAWADIKTAPRTGGSEKVSGVIFADGPSDDVVIRGSRFIGVFDGVTAANATSNLRVTGNEVDVVDDALQLGTGSSNVEFAYNFVRGVGPSRHGTGASSPLPGSKWFHHNVIDVREPVFGSRLDPATGGGGFVNSRPFSSHGGSGFGDGDPWKIYNNTLVFVDDVHNQGSGVGNTPTNLTGEPHEVYNNIFLQTQDEWVIRHTWLEGGLEMYDGNLYHRSLSAATAPLLMHYWVGDVGHRYDTLAEFRASPEWLVTSLRVDVQDLPLDQRHWDVRSVEADPELDADFRPGPGSPATSGAIDLSSTGWPGADGAPYRGARAAR